ncbi:hypothetical protein PQ465_07500 [Sphingobacterium oryzagri]|uniref:Lipocalin-like domain-containing protein n=1 Tax=Sphingobacterium oryzagri TaxID=3025669 RepID=A0ABY7WSD2_9SPHI|nr:hypothetical protein [Sphingobacterium sp. KACC 22765]WDF70214.1 hypothetical protein PQ465_07500 [Sphingobacterium sp. KACC 22765]
MLLLFTCSLLLASCKKDEDQQELLYGRWYTYSSEFIETDLEDGSVRIDKDTVENSNEYFEFTRDGKVLTLDMAPATFTQTKDSLFITVIYRDQEELYPLAYRISGNELTLSRTDNYQYEIVQQNITYRKR